MHEQRSGEFPAPQVSSHRDSVSDGQLADVWGHWLRYCSMHEPPRSTREAASFPAREPDHSSRDYAWVATTGNEPPEPELASIRMKA
jgi:hypothetical protein